MRQVGDASSNQGRDDTAVKAPSEYDRDCSLDAVRLFRIMLAGTHVFEMMLNGMLPRVYIK
jgi:hypothetical protein